MTGCGDDEKFSHNENRRQNKWMDIDNRLMGADQEQDKKAAPKERLTADKPGGRYEKDSL